MRSLARMVCCPHPNPPPRGRVLFAGRFRMWLFRDFHTLSPPLPRFAEEGGLCCRHVRAGGGDGGGGFAAKVGFGELRPKVFEGLRVAGELGFGLFARAVFAGVQAVLVVFELVPGLLVEVVEEAGAPGVPEAGVGGADVGEGQ